MKTNFKQKFKQHYSRREFFAFSLIFVLMFSALSVGMLTANAADPVYVTTETELRNAITDATEPTVIVLNADIQLTSTPLSIGTGKDIMLTSSGAGFFRLIGAPGTDTITVTDGGVLELGGIIVTHTNGVTGRGVDVQVGGTLNLSDGEISSNTLSDAILNDTCGGGVCNNGSFTMTGGVISNNTSGDGGGVINLRGCDFVLFDGVISNNTSVWGGGVSNYGLFLMFDGVISNNRALNQGGGVSNYGPFVMSGGVISNNIADIVSGGIDNNIGGDFTMSGGAVSNNTATYWGGGISNYYKFLLFDGVISNNIARQGGGTYSSGIFDMIDGVISNNNAEFGGGIYLVPVADSSTPSFTMTGGVISDNTAVDGGGICIAMDESPFIAQIVELFSGTISNNTVSNDGGGVWVAYANLDKLFVFDGMVFSNNRASAVYNRNPLDDALYHNQIGLNVVWTTPFTQGYNNYDLSYTNGYINGSPFALFYNVTVNDSHAPATGAGSYQAGDAVTVNAGTRPGYTFSNWTINQGNITLPNAPTATFTMPPNNITITANWQPIANESSFSVTKLTNPTNTNTTFSFVTSATQGTFTLTNAETWNSGNLPPGNYTLIELAQSGWDLTNIIINDPTNNSHVDLATGTVRINLSAGETISIIYQNTQQQPPPGTISVTKTSCPTNSSQAFTFVTSIIPPGTFSLTDGNTWNSGPIAPGNYIVTEIAPAGWSIANILIDDPAGNSTANLSTGTATIDLQPGSHVTIVYQNMEVPPQPGLISVVKTTCPIDVVSRFTFVTSALEGSFSLANGEIWNSDPLVPGRYIVTEIMQTGWKITDIIIVDPTGSSRSDLSTGTATIDLQAGNHVIIIYQNTQQKTPDCTPHPSCSPSSSPCTPHPSCSPSSSPCMPKHDCSMTQSSCGSKVYCNDFNDQLNHNNSSLSWSDSSSIQTSAVPIIEETPDNTALEANNTPLESSNAGSVSTGSQETQAASGGSSGSSLGSNATVSDQGFSGVDSSSVVAEDLMSGSDSESLVVDESGSSVLQTAPEGLVLSDLGGLGVVLVVLFGIILVMVAITAIHLRHRKSAKLPFSPM